MSRNAFGVTATRKRTRKLLVDPPTLARKTLWNEWFLINPCFLRYAVLLLWVIALLRRCKFFAIRAKPLSENTFIMFS